MLDLKNVPACGWQAVLLIAFWLLAMPLSLAANLVLEQDPERGIARVVDPQEWLPHRSRAALEERLGKFWAQSGIKISVLITADSPGSLDDHARRIAEKWQLANRPHGVLLVADPRAGQAALSISPELASELPQNSIDRIIQGSVNPMLRRGELAGGIMEGIERVGAFLENPNRLNASLFIRGYGAIAAFGLFLAGMLARKRFGPVSAATGSALLFGALVCLDGFGLGFHWAGVMFCAALSAGFLGLFVWIGMGDDIPKA